MTSMRAALVARSCWIETSGISFGIASSHIEGYFVVDEASITYLKFHSSRTRWQQQLDLHQPQRYKAHPQSKIEGHSATQRLSART